MPSCGPNTLFISGPSTNYNPLAGCAPRCNDVGPADCLEGNKLSPRRSRGKVIEQLKDHCLLMLGAPMVSIELSDQQLDYAVKNTLKIMEYYAPREYFNYYTFRTIPGKSLYTMPPDVGYIRHVHYRETTEYNFQSADLQGSIPIDYFHPGGSSFQGGMVDPTQPIWGRMGEWVLYKMYERMYSRVSSGLGGWEFVGGYKTIKIYPLPHRSYPVIVHYMQRCHDWDEVTMCMQEGALAMAKIMLGRVRSKFASPPGPGGGLQLDGDKLLQEGLEEYKLWKENLITSYGEPLGFTVG